MLKPRPHRNHHNPQPQPPPQPQPQPPPRTPQQPSSTMADPLDAGAGAQQPNHVTDSPRVARQVKLRVSLSSVHSDTGQPSHLQGRGRSSRTPCQQVRLNCLSEVVWQTASRPLSSASAAQRLRSAELQFWGAGGGADAAEAAEGWEGQIFQCGWGGGPRREVVKVFFPDWVQQPFVEQIRVVAVPLIALLQFQFLVVRSPGGASDSVYQQSAGPSSCAAEMGAHSENCSTGAVVGCRRCGLAATSSSSLSDSWKCLRSVHRQSSVTILRRVFDVPFAAFFGSIFRTPSSWTLSPVLPADLLSPRWPTVVGRRGLGGARVAGSFTARPLSTGLFPPSGLSRAPSTTQLMLREC